MFLTNKSYTKNEIYELLKVPLERRRGAWDTGYREYQGNIYIFSNVGIPGRTGHDYNNFWDGDLFNWEAKRKSNLHQNLIQRMINPPEDQIIYLFTRTNDKDPFTFEGKVKVLEYFETAPVKIIWQFTENPYTNLVEEAAPRVLESNPLYEGAVKMVYINKYERNPLARRMCIEHYGCFCNICKFDFYVTYGDLGKGYIHVHHLIPISSIGESYILNPEQDLIPVCPNCHGMIHKNSPPLEIVELRNILHTHGAR
jgi:5-methylcytosine-specific restriction protein A